MGFISENSLSLKAYARHLERIFSRIGVLAGTGLQADRRFHASVRLYPCDPEEERARHYRQSDMVGGGWGQWSTKARADTAASESEAPALVRWLGSADQLLLLLAPFGSGKSVVMETFVLHRARHLLASDATENELVPLPVRLRAWNWHENERFEAFLFRSQFLLGPSEDRETLPRPEFDRLLDNGSLLLLLDGFDELPGGYDCRAGVSPRERAMEEIRRLASRENRTPCRIVLSSRPGYGAENEPLFGRESRLSIGEYTESEIRSYLAMRFSGDRARSESAMAAFSRAEPDIRDILSRPIFLSAWCDRLERHPEHPLRTIPEIMRVLLARAIDPLRIKQWVGLPTEQARLFADELLTPESMARRAYGLGAVLTVFAQRRFGEPQPLAGVMEQVSRLLPEMTRQEIERLLFIATRAGFITELGDGDAYAIKVPVVEFLVGQFLGRCDDAAAQVRFLNMFRRWAWLPDLHDCLFFAFEALWAGSPEQQSLADDCCDWLLRLGTGVNSAGAPSAAAPQDDVLRPFVVLAARLGADANRAAGVLAKHRFISDEHFGSVAVPILAGLRGPLVTPYVVELLRIAGAKETDLHKQRSRETLQAAGPRVIGEHVRAFVDAVIRFPLTDNQVEYACEVALETAVSRLPQSEVESTVSAWFDSVHALPPLASRRLQGAIPEAARYATPDAAAAAVERWITQQQKTPAAVKPVLFAIIEGFARCVAEADAEARVRAWWRRALAATDGYDRQAWVRAVHAAAQQIPIDAAERVLFEGVDMLSGMIDSERSGYGMVLCEVARRVPEGRGCGVIRTLFGHLRGQSPDVQKWIAIAVTGAAERVAERDAARVIQLLQAACVGRHSDLAEKWLVAIEETARRLPHAAVLPTAERLLRWMNSERDGRDEALARAIHGAATRVGSQDARLLAERIMQALPLFGEAVRDTLAYAIHTISTRLAGEAVRPLVDQWVGMLEEDKEQNHLEMAIAFAAAGIKSEFAAGAAEQWVAGMMSNAGIVSAVLADVAERAARKLDSHEAEQAVDRWRRLAGNEENDRKRSYLWNVIWAAVSRLRPEAAMGLIQAFKADGKEEWGLRVASYQPEIAARCVDSRDRPGFEYTWRTDANLLLPVEPAPEAIRRVLGLATEAAPGLTTPGIVAAITTAIMRVFGVTKAAAFSLKLQNPSQKTKFFGRKGGLDLIERSLGENAATLRLTPSGKKPDLLVDSTVLASALESDELLRDLYALAAIKWFDVPVEFRGTGEPVVVCRFCSALTPVVPVDGMLSETIITLSAGVNTQAVSMPRCCTLCERPFADDSLVVETPARMLWCHGCKHMFAQGPVQSTWVRERRDGECPRPSCRAKQRAELKKTPPPGQKK